MTGVLFFLLAGCTSTKTAPPPVRSTDLVEVLKDNHDARDANTRKDAPTVDTILSHQEPLIIRQDKYTNDLWISDYNKSARLNEVDGWWVGPRGWRAIYWIGSLTFVGLIGYEVLSYYGLGLGGVALRLVSKIKA